jgi:hypothetical protein
MSISGPRLLTQATQATKLSRWILAPVIIGAGLVPLIVAAHLRGDAASIEHIRSTPFTNEIVPRSPESSMETAGPSSTYPSPPVFTGQRFRFGFLEFEDDADAASK